VLGLRNHLVRTLEQADAVTDPALRERLLTIVIAGGGFAGVEMAAAIAGLMRHERRNYPVLRRHGFRMVLAHGGEDILPQLRPRYEKLAEYAAEQLTAQGVWIRRETRVVNVTEEGAVFDDGSVLRSATVISTLGQMRTILPGTESFARTPDNRIMADRELRVRGRPNIWVGGDIADVEHPRNGEPCPANALWAIKHGEHAGANIARTLRGQPLRPFSFPGLGQAASFGVGKGITELYGMQFTGWVAWAMRLGLFEYFMPSRKQAVRVALDWLTLPILGRHGESLEATAPGEHAYASERPVEDPPAYAAVEVDDPEQEQTVNGYQAAKA
jgi:NADH dehydrogenase